MIEITWELVEHTAAIVGLVTAYWQYSEKRKIKRYTKTTLQRLAGNAAKIQQSTDWAYNNCRDAINGIAELPESPLKPELIRFIANAEGDAKAADRLIINLFNEILSDQEAQFGSREIKHPEEDELLLVTKEKSKSYENTLGKR